MLTLTSSRAVWNPDRGADFASAAARVLTLTANAAPGTLTEVLTLTVEPTGTPSGVLTFNANRAHWNPHRGADLEC